MEIYLISMWETRLSSLAFASDGQGFQITYITLSVEEIDEHEGDGLKARTKQQSTSKQL